jgi:hypothetical protein
MLGLIETLAHEARQRLCREQRARLIALLVLGVVLAGGCVGESKGSPAATTATTGAPSTTSSQTDSLIAAETAVLDSYRAFWDDVVAAGRKADWQSPRLADHAAGQALKQVRDHFKALRAAGLVDLGTVELHPKVVSLAERTATVSDCVDVSRFLRHDAKTLEPRETPDPRLDAGVATLTLTNGTWKVTRTVQKGKCP